MSRRSFGGGGAGGAVDLSPYLKKTDAAATYQQVWKPNTAYAQNAIVVSPLGQLVKRKAAGTSGASYDATMWDIVATGSSTASGYGVMGDLGAFELQPMWVTGHSWQVAGTSGSRYFERIARRLGTLGSPTNKAQAGRTIGDVSTASLSGTLGWTARTRALVLSFCTINDVTLFDGTDASRRGYQHAWRALLCQLVANGSVAANTASFTYSAGWTAQSITVSTAQGANTNSTGGTQFRTTTVGAYADFTVTGDAVDVFLVARAAGAGLATFTVAGTTVASLDLTQPTAQDCPAAARITGLGTGTKTVRVTLTSGASLTIDSYRVPSPAPTVGLVLGEPTLIPGITNSAAWLANVETLKGDLATIVAGFPTFGYLDLNAPGGWDKTTMLVDDGRHLNDRGASFVGDKAMAALAKLPWSNGLNALSAAATPAAYVVPGGPPIPSGGQDGLGNTGGASAPGQVTGLTLSPGNGQLGASWAAPAGSPTDYVIQYRTTSGPGAWTTFNDGTSTATSTTITGLTNGTSYDVQVAAVNANGQGTYSAIQTASPTASSAITEDANVADGNLIGKTTTTGGKTWALTGTTPVVISGNAIKCGGGSAGSSYATVDTTVTTGRVQATLTAVSGTPSTMISGLALRVVDANNNITIQLRRTASAAAYAISERTGGSAAVLANSGAVIPTAGDIVVAEFLSETSLRVLVNGAVVIPPTTISLAGNGKHGLFFNSSDTVSTWDNWSWQAA